MQVSPIKKDSLQYLVLLAKRNLKRIGTFTKKKKSEKGKSHSAQRVLQRALQRQRLCKLKVVTCLLPDLHLSLHGTNSV